jgi:hypothetical protein
MDSENYMITRFRLLKISEYCTGVQDVLGGDPAAENYCREIWDACAALNCIVDKLCTKI